MRRRLDGRPAIRHDLNGLGRQAPGHKTLLDEPARRDEAVDLAEQGF
jgi:hypothetical protein